MPDFSHEDALGGIVAGIDEAGRGPLAGPVVAAAVVLERPRLPAEVLEILDDSKRLARARREYLYDCLHDCARIGVGIASVAEIDRINILRASLVAMDRALREMGAPVDCALVDGNQKPPLPCRVRCLVGGDALSFSVAAASIIAKVTRDRIMAELALEFPGYGWETNAGYSTREHFAALERLGVTPHHRRSFAPIARMLGEPVGEEQAELFSGTAEA